MLLGLFIYVTCVAAVFLTCLQQHVVDVLAVASSRSIPPRPNNIFMYIAMPIHPRVVMTEIRIHVSYISVIKLNETDILHMR